VYLLAAVAAASCSNSLRSIRSANEQLPAKSTSRFEWDRSSEPTAPEEWFLSQRVYRQGIPAGALARAWNQAAEIDRLTALRGAVLGGAWSFAGPTNIGGRILDIAVDPAQADTIYVAAASGGVWKSIDAGRTFSLRWPDDTSQTIGSLAFAADGTLYAGTGETGPGGGSLTYGGSGLYRSTDGGESWEPAGLEGSSRIARLAMDASDPKRIFVAVAGSLFLPGGDRGVYRSLDGGQTWEQVLEGDTPTTGATDIAIDPSNPDRIFATLWDHQRMPDLRRYSGLGSGVYRSDDGGDSWTRLENGLPPATPTLGRIGLAVAPSDPSRVYVITTRSTLGTPSDGVFEGFYASTDGGDSFVRLPNDSTLAGSQSSYGWWFGRVWVDPSDPNSVFVAGVPLLHSRSGGVGWEIQGSVHADQHAMAWDSNTDGRVYLGNDGGVYTSRDNGRTWTSATFQPWTQLYTVDVSRTDPTRLVGGAQDNGVNRSYRGSQSGDPDHWNSYVGGDGLAARIDPTDQNRVYGCFQYGNCYRSLNGGDMTQAFGATSSDRRNWLTPVEFDPTDPRIMYYAGNLLNRSTDAAVTWSAISPDLTGGQSPNRGYQFGTITTVAAAQTDGSVLYLGTDDGRVWTTKDLGASWTRLSDPQFPDAWVTRVAIDPGDANVAYVTFSGYRSGDQQGYVFRTSDGGKSWEDLTGDLPLAPVNDIILIDASLMVASDLGVFASDDGQSWSRAGSGLPAAPITQLRFEPQSRKLFAATFGRGMYSLEVAAKTKSPAGE
jgi:photosystem II stability/assembly factor-like uncharacterized protein